MNKSDVTQELVNVFPSWSKVRSDDQSVGYQALNTMANSMERMERQLRVIRDNQFLSTANLDEIDITYKVILGPGFEFDEDNTDPLFACPVAPEVSGLISGVWHDVEIAPDNDLESFWYDSIPNRITLADVVSGENHEMVTLDAGDSPVSGLWLNHLRGGHLWVETTGGVQYLQFENNSVKRAKVVLEGRTRKGTYEEETLIFAWDQKQRTLKEWKELYNVGAFDMEDEIEIDVRSADFNNGPYLSPWNLKYSDRRNKIDEFWDVGHNGDIPTLDRLEYQSDEWQQLVLGFSDTDVRDRWELLKSTDNPVSGVDVTISGVDMAIQPYTNRVWVATEDTLYLYDLREEMVSGVNDFLDRTPGAHIQIDYEEDSVLLGEPILFTPWHARPLKELLSYKIWYRRPDGTRYGILGGSEVDINTDHTVKITQGTPLSRTIENLIEIPTTQRGEYLVVFEGTFIDGEQQTYSRIFNVRYKLPLAEIPVSGIVPDPIEGIDFDSDQKMWVKTSDKYYRLDLHTDIMLIDYENKIIYFKEEYESVGIETDG